MQARPSTASPAPAGIELVSVPLGDPAHAVVTAARGLLDELIPAHHRAEAVAGPGAASSKWEESGP